MSGSTGPIGVEAWAGVKVEGELDVAIFVDGKITKGGCGQDKSALGVITATGTISVEGGFEARVWFKKLSFNLVKGVIDGEIVGNFSIGTKCDGDTCVEKGINDASLAPAVYGEVCFMGWCHKEYLFD